MNQDPFLRSRMLLGDEPLARLARSKVAIFGLGGVGGHCADALARAGVGSFHLFDDDRVSVSNLNRQLVALHSTLGERKVDVMARRIVDINPLCQVEATPLFYTPERGKDLDLSHYDYVVDCIDTVTAKLDLAQRCSQEKIPLISSMGSANKLDPSAFEVTDISKTQGCPLARIMRKELRKRGIFHLKVVYSQEEARRPLTLDSLGLEEEPSPGQEERPGKLGHKQTPGSLPFVPATAGLLLAWAVAGDLGGYS